MRAFLDELVVLPYDQHVATRWGESQAYAQLRGRPRPANDPWIAACCLVRELPLATFNIKDYADFAEHEGLELVHRGHSAWDVSWSEPQNTGGHQTHRTRTESPARRREDRGDHEIYRSPEAGAQVRILPGALRLNCSYYGP